jgi:hypothetical protein
MNLQCQPKTTILIYSSINIGRKSLGANALHESYFLQVFNYPPSQNHYPYYYFYYFFFFNWQERWHSRTPPPALASSWPLAAVGGSALFSAFIYFSVCGNDCPYSNFCTFLLCGNFLCLFYTSPNGETTIYGNFFSMIGRRKM